LSGVLCACCVVHCDCRSNRGSVQQSIIIIGGFLCMPIGLCLLSVELCACVVVHIDFRWNCCSVHWSIVIVRGNEGVFSSL
jgi:hypothetical protein